VGFIFFFLFTNHRLTHCDDRKATSSCLIENARIEGKTFIIIVSDHMPIPKAPQSGDYVSINDSDSDTGKDTEDDDRVIDHTANRETGLERQNEGFARSIRDLSLDQRQRRRSLMEEDGDALTLDVPPIEEQGEKEKPITWMSLVRFSSSTQISFLKLPFLL